MSRTRLLAAATLLALCAAAAAADPATAAVEARQRACRAALGVLRRCAFSSATREQLRDRCCSLLDTFTAHGCLCPPGSDCQGSDLSSATGMQLSTQLAPIMEMCAPTPAANAIESAAPLAEEAAEPLPVVDEEGQVYDEDDAMADMAGLAAAAQNPHTAHVEQPTKSIPLPADDVAPLLDTPTDDYDNWLTDADAAFMLVDPSFAYAYASRAASAESALSQAADAVAADVAVVRGKAAGPAAEAEGRLQHLLASLDMSLEDLERKLATMGSPASEAERRAADPEDVASAAAVSDDESLSDAASQADPQLAPVDAVPQTADQRRAAALAAALESMQARNLAQRSSQLAVDVTLESGDAESARHLADSVLAVLKSWQASAYSSSTTQAELAAALQATAQRVVAAASTGGSLGRSGLQVEERRRQLGSGFSVSDEPRACTCMSVQFDENDELYDDLLTVLRRRYIAARLALCRFACAHQHTLAFLLVAELALCLAWLLVWAVRGSILPSGGDDCDSPTHLPRGCPQESQFVVASAADPQWQAEMQQPLLDTRGSASDSC